mgnify:CR=1 FL=1
MSDPAGKGYTRKTIRSCCRLCYNTCGVLIHLTEGVPSKIEGDPDNPMSRGALCPKGQASLEYLNHPDRLRFPLKRVGERGKGGWARVSWEEALRIVADGLHEVKKQYGVLSTVFIRGASKGLSDDLLARFANIFGSPNITSPAPYCFVPAVRSSQLTYGFYAYADYDFGPKVILIWGFNPSATNVCDYERIRKAKEQGAKLIAIDPLDNELTRISDIWLRPRPGTDTALGLAMIHVLINEGIYDGRFVNGWTVGFAQLADHVKKYSPENVEGITWVAAEAIRGAARIYAMEKPGLVLAGNGIETTQNSFHTCRTAAILRAISGNLGLPGGEVKYSLPGGLGRGDPVFLCQDNISPEIRNQRLSAKDGLLPINYYALPQRILKAILEDDPYPVRAAYIQGANLLTQWPNGSRVLKALQKLDFVAVADQFMTPTAMMADVVLPVATYLEFDSVEQPWHYPIASIQQKVAQIGECWSDGRILNELLRTLGFHQYVWEDINECLDVILKPAGITFEEFKRIGTLLGEKRYRHYEKEGFDTSSRKVELYSKTLEEWGFDPLPIYRELPETLYNDPSIEKEYRLILTSKKADVYRHSGGRQIPSLRCKRPEPVLRIHPRTAHGLGVHEGEWVIVTTGRGRIKQRAFFDESLDRRVVEVDYAWWFPEKNVSALFGWDESNINLLTDDQSPHNREMGSPNMRGIFCNVFRAEG